MVLAFLKAAEKFKAPEASVAATKEAEQETAPAEGGEESDNEEVSLLSTAQWYTCCNGLVYRTCT